MSSATDLERLFKAGINAYQQGEYSRAIVALSRVSRGDNSAYRIKANMGLVKVYMSQKNWPKAKSLCEKIGTSSKPALQEWSQTTLTKIDHQKRLEASVPVASQAREDNNAAVSGFVPLESAQKQSTSGFTPLSTEAQSSSGFQPLKLDATDKQPSNFIEHAASQHQQPSALQAINFQSKAIDLIADSVVDAGSSLVGALSGQSRANSQADGREVTASTSDASCLWKYANRLEKGRSLGKIKRSQLWVAQIFSAITFFYLFRTVLRTIPHAIDSLLLFWANIRNIWVPTLPHIIADLTWPLLGALGLITLLSPWIWDVWLRFVASRKALSMTQLRSHSIEAATLISRHCKKKRRPLHKLWHMPNGLPINISNR